MKEKEKTMVVTLTTDQLSELMETAVSKALAAEREHKETVAREIFITRQQVMQMLQISPVTLWKLDKKGLLDKRRIGRKVLYAKSSVEELRAVQL